MSPKIHEIEEVDAPMELVDLHSQGGQVDIVTTMIVNPGTSSNLLGATLSAPSQPHPLSESPVKVHLRREIREYQEAVSYPSNRRNS